MTRTTRQWQAADAAHHLHPFTDFKSLAERGSRIIVRGDNIYLWDSEGHRILDTVVRHERQHRDRRGHRHAEIGEARDLGVGQDGPDALVVLELAGARAPVGQPGNLCGAHRHGVSRAQSASARSRRSRQLPGTDLAHSIQDRAQRSLIERKRLLAFEPVVECMRDNGSELRECR